MLYEVITVCVSATVDCIIRAGLHAGIAFPAHVGFDVVGATGYLVDMHDV